MVPPWLRSTWAVSRSRATTRPTRMPATRSCRCPGPSSASASSSWPTTSQPDVLRVAGVEGAVDRVVLLQPRTELEHDHVDEATFGGRLELLGPAAIVSGKAHEPHPAGLLDGLGGGFHLPALGPVDLIASQAVEKQQVDIIGSERRQPLVDLLDHLVRFADVILGGQKDLLADLRLGREPGLEPVLDMVARGRVEITDASKERITQQTVERIRRAPRTRVDDRHLGARLAQPPAG